MRADDRVLVHHGLAPLDAASGGGRIDLLDAGVGGLESVETLTEEGAETLIGLGGVDEEGVTTSLGLVEDVQEGGSGGLLLIGDIGVPGDGTCAVGEELIYAVVASSAVDEVDLWEAFGRARCGVDVVAAELLVLARRFTWSQSTYRPK